MWFTVHGDTAAVDPILFVSFQSEWRKRGICTETQGWTGNLWEKNPTVRATKPTHRARERKYPFTTETVRMLL